MTIKAYALNRIHRKNADGTPNHVLAKTVFATTLDEYNRLEPLGAVRRATAEEIAIDNAQRKAENGGVAIEDDKTSAETPKKVEPKKVEPKKGGAKKAASDDAGAGSGEGSGTSGGDGSGTSGGDGSGTSGGDGSGTGSDTDDEI